jgi:hypothetical protein
VAGNTNESLHVRKQQPYVMGRGATIGVTAENMHRADAREPADPKMATAWPKVQGATNTLGSFKVEYFL